MHVIKGVSTPKYVKPKNNSATIIVVLFYVKSFIHPDTLN